MIKEIILADAKVTIGKELLLAPFYHLHEVRKSFDKGIGIDNNKILEDKCEKVCHEQVSKFFLDKKNLVQGAITLSFEGSGINMYDKDGKFEYVMYENNTVDGINSFLYKAEIDYKYSILTIKKVYCSNSFKEWVERCYITYETREMDRTPFRIQDVIKSEQELYRYKFYKPYGRLLEV